MTETTDESGATHDAQCEIGDSLFQPMLCRCASRANKDEIDAIVEVERRLREQLNETMIAAQGGLAEDRCEALHSDLYQRDGYACVECSERAADVLPDSWDERVVRAVLEPLERSTTPDGCDHTYPPANTDGTCPSCGKPRVITPATSDGSPS